MKGITVYCEGEKSLKEALSTTKAKKIKLPKKFSLISYLSKLVTTDPELKLVKERG